MKKKKANVYREQPVSWLPIDSRLVLPLFSFGHVKGVAKVFITIEMILATAVVLGTCVRVFLHFFNM